MVWAVYYVIGTSGSESWVAKVYRRAYSARCHAELANRWAHQHGCVHSCPELLPPNPFDAKMLVRSTGVEYHYEEAFSI